MGFWKGFLATGVSVAVITASGMANASGPIRLHETELDRVTAGNPALLFLAASAGVGFYALFSRLAAIGQNPEVYFTYDDEGAVVEGRMNPLFFHDGATATLEGMRAVRSVPRGMPKSIDVFLGVASESVNPANLIPPPSTNPNNQSDSVIGRCYCVEDF
jgi:hypothetical protein